MTSCPILAHGGSADRERPLALPAAIRIFERGHFGCAQCKRARRPDCARMEKHPKPNSHRRIPVCLVDDNWVAPNRAQGWQTTFGPEGAQVNAANGSFDTAQDKGWSWGLTPTSYGYGEKLTGFTNLSGLTADKETVTYQWDANLSE